MLELFVEHDRGDCSMASVSSASIRVTSGTRHLIEDDKVQTSSAMQHLDADMPETLQTKCESTTSKNGLVLVLMTLQASDFIIRSGPFSWDVLRFRDGKMFRLISNGFGPEIRSNDEVESIYWGDAGCNSSEFSIRP